MVTNSVTRILLIETLHKFEPLSADLPQASINSSVLYVPPRFLAFHIP